MQSVFLLWRVCPVCSMVKRRFPARTPEVETLFMLLKSSSYEFFPHL
jgi:hypothetical protein